MGYAARMGRATKADGPGGVHASVGRDAMEAAVRRVCGQARARGTAAGSDARLIEQAMKRWLAIFRPRAPLGPGQDHPDAPAVSPARILAEGLRALGVPAAVRECPEDGFETEITVVHHDAFWASVDHPCGDGTMVHLHRIPALLEVLRPMCAGFTPDMLAVRRGKGCTSPGVGFEAVWEQVLAHAGDPAPDPDVGACEDCGTTEGVILGPCPYAQDVHGDDTEHALCGRCSDNRADDI